MVQNSRAARPVTAGLLITIGLILPYFTAHVFAIPGTILLPMHIPVLLCGLLCGPRYGALTGILVPVLSCLLTNMPAFYPMLPILTVQLLGMGILSGLLYRKMKLPVYPSLLLAVLSGWALYGLAYAVLLLAGSGTLRALSVTAALLQGIPGLLIQLTFIPLLLSVLKRFGLGSTKENLPRNKILAEARGILQRGEASCVIIKENTITHKADGRGVSPLLNLYEQSPEKLKDAFVVDKIIGKAAAMILVLGGASEAYGEIMSAAARDFLMKYNVTFQFGRCVDVISARDKNGICPIEKSVLEIDDPREGLAKLKDTLLALRKQAG